jgi:hypothetical protein
MQMWNYNEIIEDGFELETKRFFKNQNCFTYI